jgi:hypothetical protein
MRRFLAGALFVAAVPGLMAAGYKVGGKLGEGSLKSQITGIVCDKNDNITVITGNGDITVINGESGEAKKLEAKVPGASTAACDGQGNLYVLTTKTEAKEFVYDGRKMKQNVPVSVDCQVFKADGEKSAPFTLKGVKSANAAAIIDDKLLTADYGSACVQINSAKDGSSLGKIGKNFRLCCGIFHFSVTPDKNAIVVSNLGAFRVETYSLAGKKISDFGKRGESLADFHGCCNPVSAQLLPDGSYLTVEKDPTRIKIYDKSLKNASLIEDVESLTQGCQRVPMAADSKGNIYLASSLGNKPFIIKCVKK